MQQHELIAWLGGNEQKLTAGQLSDLLTIANEVEQRYPDQDDAQDREAALTVAFRLMVEDPEEVMFELSHELTTARLAESTVLAKMKQAARILVPDEITEAGYATRVGVDRMTVRKWLGKR